MSREELERESDNSVSSLDRKKSTKEEEGGLHQTLSKSNLQEM